jgi:hypothetical protein
MDDKAPDKRQNSFRWNSKQELCDYFSIHHGLSKKLVEAEIEEAIRSFRIRKGQAIQTLELWQKAGLAIEKKITEANL